MQKSEYCQIIISFTNFNVFLCCIWGAVFMAEITPIEPGRVIPAREYVI